MENQIESLTMTQCQAGMKLSFIKGLVKGQIDDLAIDEGYWQTFSPVVLVQGQWPTQLGHYWE